MFDMVLKFGAQIVDALQAYTQPIIVYIPPYGELRGGAWAVLDTQINSTCITMLSDVDGRGGVLEPTGIVEIKFRQADIFKLMSRDDSTVRALEAELNNESLSKIEKAATASALEKRRELLMSTFHSGAVKFSDLFDMPARMLATGAIHVCICLII
jgi:acetyl-CoA carboxylase carboxyltransferase component